MCSLKSSVFKNFRKVLLLRTLFVAFFVIYHFFRAELEWTKHRISVLPIQTKNNFFVPTLFIPSIFIWVPPQPGAAHQSRRGGSSSLCPIRWWCSGPPQEGACPGGACTQARCRGCSRQGGGAAAEPRHCQLSWSRREGGGRRRWSVVEEEIAWKHRE